MTKNNKINDNNSVNNLTDKSKNDNSPKFIGETIYSKNFDKNVLSKFEKIENFKGKNENKLLNINTFLI